MVGVEGLEKIRGRDLIDKRVMESGKTETE